MLLVIVKTREGVLVASAPKCVSVTVKDLFFVVVFFNLKLGETCGE